MYPCLCLCLYIYIYIYLYTCRIQNPDTRRADRVGRRTAGRLSGAGLAGLFAQDTNLPRALEGIENKCLERLFGSTNQGIPM